MNIEQTTVWIGLKLPDGGKIVRYLDSGSEFVVFEVARGTQSSVLRIPRDHLGFLIELPPGDVFPSAARGSSYEQVLLARVRAIKDSAALSHVFPLSGLWNALAVQYLRDVDRHAQLVRLEDFPGLRSAQFAHDRLVDWASMPTRGTDDHDAELDRNVVTIFDNRRPIHAAFTAELLAEDARAALREFPEVRESVMGNPLIPWIIALVNGYELPRAAVDLATADMRSARDQHRHARNAGEIVLYVSTYCHAEEKIALLAFVAAVLDASAPNKELVKMCLRSAQVIPA